MVRRVLVLDPFIVPADKFMCEPIADYCVVCSICELPDTRSEAGKSKPSDVSVAGSPIWPPANPSRLE